MKFECVVCSEEFKTSSDFIVHSQIHSEEKRYKCHVYDKTFSKSENLNSHVTVHTVHAAQEEYLSCIECEKCFTSRIGLSQHMNMLLGKYKCAECGKCFGSNKDLAVHR